MTKKNALVTKTWLGTFWLPERDQEQVPGVLEQDAEGHFVLSLIGALGIGTDRASNVAIIHGLTNDQQVTLLNSYEITRSRSTFYGGPDTQKVGANRVLFGILLPSPDAACFTRVTVAVENAMQFLYHHSGGTRSGRSRRTKAAPLGLDQETLLRLDRPEFRYAGLTFTAYAEQTGFRHHRSRGSSSSTATTTPKFVIRGDAPFALAQADRLGKSLMDLLTLASGEPCGEVSMMLHWSSPELVERLTKEREHLVALSAARGEHAPVPDEQQPSFEEMATVAGSMIFPARPDDPEQDHYRYMFSCRDIPFSKVGPAWLALREKVRPALDIFFGLDYVSTGFLEEKAMEVAIVAESLQRDLYDDHLKLMTKGEFRSLRSSVEAKLTKAEFAAVGKMMHNSPSFPARMHTLLRKLDRALITIVVPDADSWVSQLTERRHSLAHGRAAKVIMEEKNLRMMYLIEQTSLVVRLVLAGQLGIPLKRQLEYLQARQELHTFRAQVTNADLRAAEK